MTNTAIRRLGLSQALTLTLLLSACGDPCLDDGLGRGNCNEDDSIGSADTGTETAEAGTNDAEAGTNETEAGTNDAEAGTTETGGGEIYCVDGDDDGFGDPDDCEEVPAGEDPPAGSVPESQANDCDDDDPNTFPGAAELDDPDACMTDADDDGYGDDMPSNPNAEAGTDCNDASVTTFPGAAELDDPDACMQDDDDDGYGDSTPPNASTAPGSDCNDDDPVVFNCSLWCLDADSDGFGDPDNCIEVLMGEDPPENYVEDDNDCADDYANAFPGAAELEDPDACMLDDDMDGWGDTDPPIDAIVPGNDCDDADMSRVVCADAIPACAETTLGGSADLMAVATGGDGNYSFSWEPPETLDDPAIAGPQATPLEITTYTVTATDGLGNMGSDEVTIHITDKAWVLGGDDAECEAVGFLGAPAEHTFSQNGTQTCTTTNSDPTAFVCPTVHESARITGTMVVNTAADDDIVGFVWGWQNEDQFYLLSWKQSYQNWFGCDGNEGITIKRVDRSVPYTTPDFACDTDTANVSVLMGPAETTTDGWLDNREYAVEILYSTTQTEITITDTTTNLDVASFTVEDGTYPNGKFGTYDFSQEQACNGPWQSSCL